MNKCEMSMTLYKVSHGRLAKRDIFDKRGFKFVYAVKI